MIHPRLLFINRSVSAATRLLRPVSGYWQGIGEPCPRGLLPARPALLLAGLHRPQTARACSCTGSDDSRVHAIQRAIYRQQFVRNDDWLGAKPGRGCQVKFLLSFCFFACKRVSFLLFFTQKKRLSSPIGLISSTPWVKPSQSGTGCEVVSGVWCRILSGTASFFCVVWRKTCLPTTATSSDIKLFWQMLSNQFATLYFTSRVS